MTDEIFDEYDINRNTIELTKEEIEQRINAKNQEKLIGFPDIDHYYEYKKLDGKKNRKNYFKMLDVFLEETLDIFVFGDPIKHKSRDDALEVVKKILKINDKELDILFHSVDNVTAYTWGVLRNENHQIWR